MTNTINAPGDEAGTRPYDGVARGTIHRRLLVAALLLALSACGGELGATPPPSGGSGATPGVAAEFSPQMEALLLQRYSSTPELKGAAIGLARAMQQETQSAVSTGKYDPVLSTKTGNAQICLTVRVRKYGKEFDLAGFVAAMTTTRATLKAYTAADKLQSGHPLKIWGTEEDACPAGGIQ